MISLFPLSPLFPLLLHPSPPHGNFKGTEGGGGKGAAGGGTKWGRGKGETRMGFDESYLVLLSIPNDSPLVHGSRFV